MNNNLKNTPDTNDRKNKAKNFWKNVGLIGIALVLAVVTFFVISL